MDNKDRSRAIPDGKRHRDDQGESHWVRHHRRRGLVEKVQDKIDDPSTKER